MIIIRGYEERDWVEVWALLRPVFRAGETYAFPRDISEAEARYVWTEAPDVACVAIDPVGERVLGTYYMKANHPGPGSHVCNCGYVVSPEARGMGIATEMCLHSQDLALERGYRSMQYNLVASSNQGAVRLWSRLGFEIVGTLPEAFEHPTRGYVDAFVMYKHLTPSDP